ncbi:MAG: hypothetical protein HDR03_12295 [Lachnospiraceae bacterium]|nr:hypothetical protein [Lachnospiraceae bacterium]
MKVCKNYVGGACVSGECPKALRDEYAECGMDVINDCSDCGYYLGCEDCAMPYYVGCDGKSHFKR